MPIVYSGWGSKQLQSNDWYGDLYVNPTADLSQFEWLAHPTFGRILRIGQPESYAGDSVQGKAMVGPHVFSESEPNALKEFSVAWHTMVPQGLPLANLAPNYPWFQIAEFEGMPNDGSPSIGVDISAHPSGGKFNQWVLQADAETGYALLWKGPPVVYDQYHAFSLNVYLDENPAVGYVEVIFNGVKQTLENGKTRYYYRTLGPGVKTGPERFIMDQYRGKGLINGPYSVYHAAPYFATPGPCGL